MCKCYKGITLKVTIRTKTVNSTKTGAIFKMRHNSMKKHVYFKYDQGSAGYERKSVLYRQ